MITLPPFKAFLASNIPSVYDNTLTYYEELVKLIAYLEDQVVPAVNETASQVDGIKKGLEELKSYVDNYFDNLDVQEEINNKLDEMAEGGQLAGIIAQFLELAPVFAYGTINDMANADNLSNGCIARVLGNTSATAGDGAYYTIRTRIEADNPDGVNLVAIGDTLVGERILGTYHFVVGATATASDIQDLIDIPGEKIIEFTKGATYTLTSALHLTSGTHLELNGATLFFYFVDPTEETIGIYNYSENDTYTGYAGAQNVSVRNGFIKQGCVALMHGNGTVFENIEFVDMYCRHCIQIAGCKDTTIKACVFNGVYANAGYAEAAEVINIDPTIYAAQPYLDEESVMYDNTQNKGIYITECRFNNPVDATYAFYQAVGAHTHYNNFAIYSHNIQIKDCVFGTPYNWAICLNSMDDVLIEGNTLHGDSSLGREDGVYFIMSRYANNNVNIFNNNISGIQQFYHMGVRYVVNYNVIIKDNVIEVEGTSRTKPGLVVIGVNNFVLDNNFISTNHTALLVDGDEELSVTNTDVFITNNTMYGTTNTSILRVWRTSNTYIIGNSLYTKTDASNYMTEYGNLTDKFVVANNNINNKGKLCATSFVNKDFSNNGAFYPVITFYDSGTLSDSGSFDKAITNFKKLYLVIGTGTNTQVVELLPFLYNGEYLDDRTYKFSLVNNDNSFGYGVLTVSNSGADYTYSGTVHLRMIYAAD